MPRESASKGKKPTGPAEPRRGYKVRSTNDLQLLSMILDEEPLLRERVLRFLEAQLGKRVAVKVDPEGR